jgi:dephospho-CoA kinase
VIDEKKKKIRPMYYFGNRKERKKLNKVTKTKLQAELTLKVKRLDGNVFLMDLGNWYILFRNPLKHNGKI